MGTPRDKHEKGNSAAVKPIEKSTRDKSEEHRQCSPAKQTSTKYTSDTTALLHTAKRQNKSQRGTVKPDNAPEKRCHVNVCNFLSVRYGSTTIAHAHVLLQSEKPVDLCQSPRPSDHFSVYFPNVARSLFPSGWAHAQRNVPRMIYAGYHRWARQAQQLFCLVIPLTVGAQPISNL